MNGTLGVVMMGVLVLMLLLVVILLLPVLVLVVMVVLELVLVVMEAALLLLVVGAEEGAMAMSAPVKPGTAILARMHPSRLCKSFQFPCSRLIATDLGDYDSIRRVKGGRIEMSLEGRMRVYLRGCV